MPLSYNILYKNFFQKSTEAVALVSGSGIPSLPQIFIHTDHFPQVRCFIVDSLLIITSHLSSGTLITSFRITIRAGTMDFIFRVLMEIIIIFPISFAPTEHLMRNAALSQCFTDGYISIICSNQITSSSLFNFLGFADRAGDPQPLPR